MQTLLEFMNRDRLKKYKPGKSYDWCFVEGSDTKFCYMGDIEWVYESDGQTVTTASSDWFAIVYRLINKQSGYRQLLFWSPDNIECPMIYLYPESSKKLGNFWYIIYLDDRYQKIKNIFSLTENIFGKDYSREEFIKNNWQYALTSKFTPPKEIKDFLQENLSTI